MRFFLLALLIALMPFRGWMGDAMAMAQVAHPAQHGAAHQGAASAAPPTAQQVSTQAAALLATLHPCAEHSEHIVKAQGTPSPAAMAAADGDTAHAHADETQPQPHQHKTCDVCNGPAMALGNTGAVRLMQPHGVRISRTVRFASTVLPQGIKPPIS